MNIDFSTEPGFSAYVLLLMASGIAMVVVASPAVRRSTMFLRVLNTVVGLGFLGATAATWRSSSTAARTSCSSRHSSCRAVLIFRTVRGIEAPAAGRAGDRRRCGRAHRAAGRGAAALRPPHADGPAPRSRERGRPSSGKPNSAVGVGVDDHAADVLAVQHVLVALVDLLER